MLINQSIENESEWISYLEDHLTALETQNQPSQTARTREEESARLNNLNRPSKPVAHIALQPTNTATSDSITMTSTAIVPKKQFRAGTVDRKVITQLSGKTLSQSRLSIKAKPKLVISSQQVYRQITPVTVLSDPLKVENFWLWADPKDDLVELDIPKPVYRKLPKTGWVKPLPGHIILDERVVRRGSIKALESSKSAIAQPLAEQLRRRGGSPKLDRSRIQRIQIPARRAFFAMATPELQEFQLTIRQNDVSAITGGTVLMTVSIYSQAGEDTLEQQRIAWTDALESAGYGFRLWKFIPVNLRNLQAFVDLERQQLSSPIQTAAINPDTGTATFIIELSAIGATLWKQALEQRQPDKIVGVGRFKMNFYARTRDRLQVHPQTLAVNLRTLLENCGPEHIETLAPMLSLTTTLIVQSSPIVDTVSATWKPKQSDPIHQSFDDEGGLLTGVVLSEDLNTVQIDWNTEIKYKLAGWAVGKDKGQLSLNNATQIIKPGSSRWVKEYTLYTLFMDGQTQVAADLSVFDDIEVEATFTFSAPYLASPLQTIFQPTHFALTDVQFPLAPGQTPNNIGIAIATKSRSSGRLLGTAQRALNFEETLSNAKIFQDGRVEISTNHDKHSESSINADIFALLNQLQG